MNRSLRFMFMLKLIKCKNILENTYFGLDKDEENFVVKSAWDVLKTELVGYTVFSILKNLNFFHFSRLVCVQGLLCIPKQITV